ncbi:hypothetical protein IB276_32840 [Ensifer sp. ENS04]|uniref:hypothetical protein n=1 Tax=Ensifer sp. ENS04 TaxID=2769281 RepID=UPI0017809A2A|nr:hypothetical protein [Ensifer sp. ENS04]MBD9544233.1 hypothetical protein [Ensifer sp. ENS04]
MDVRYYLINEHGRSQMRATNDEDALAEAELQREMYATKQKRVVKEIRETIWEADNG